MCFLELQLLQAGRRLAGPIGAAPGKWNDMIHSACRLMAHPAKTSEEIPSSFYLLFGGYARRMILASTSPMISRLCNHLPFRALVVFAVIFFNFRSVFIAIVTSGFQHFRSVGFDVTRSVLRVAFFIGLRPSAQIRPDPLAIAFNSFAIRFAVSRSALRRAITNLFCIFRFRLTAQFTSALRVVVAAYGSVRDLTVGGFLLAWYLIRSQDRNLHRLGFVLVRLIQGTQSLGRADFILT